MGFGNMRCLKPKEETISPVAPLIGEKHEAKGLSCGLISCINEKTIVNVLKNVIGCQLKVSHWVPKYFSVLSD